MEPLVAALLVLVAGYALVARRLNRWSIGPAFVFVAAGIVTRLLWPGEVPTVDLEFALQLVEVTLALVLFTDASTGPPTTWSWDFGDGSNSNRQSPRHVYDDGGDYQVTLTVTNAVGSDSKTQTVTVANETGIPVPSGG